MLRGMRWIWRWTWTIKLYRDYVVFCFCFSIFFFSVSVAAAVFVLVFPVLAFFYLFRLCCSALWSMALLGVLYSGLQVAGGEHVILPFDDFSV